MRKTCFRIVCLFALLTASPSFISAEVAVSLEDLLQCRAIDDESLRLQCYDSVLDQMAAPAPQDSSDEHLDLDPAGAWAIEESINPLDDSKRVVGSLIATEGEGTSGPVTLYLRCESGKIEAYIIWQSFLGISAAVVARFDKEEPTTRQWKISTDGRGTFFPGNAIPFIAKVGSADRLAVQVNPRAGSRLTAVFDVGSSSEVARKVFAACRRN